MTNLGIAQTQALVGLALSLANAVGKSMADGKVTIGDMHNFIGPLLGSGDAIQGAVHVPAELKDLDQAEADALFAYAKETFQVPDDKVQAAVQTALVIAAKVVELVLLVKENVLPADSASV